jgi:hypothetical protein
MMLIKGRKIKEFEEFKESQEFKNKRQETEFTSYEDKEGSVNQLLGHSRTPATP